MRDEFVGHIVGYVMLFVCYFCYGFVFMRGSELPYEPYNESEPVDILLRDREFSVSWIVGRA